MDFAHTPLAFYLRKMRELSGVSGVSGADLMKLAGQCARFVDEAEPGTPEHSRGASALAFALAGLMASSGDHAVLRQGLEALLGLDVLGGSLAHMALRKGALAPDALAGLLGGLPVSLRLAFFNRLFQSPHGVEPRVLALAFETLAEALREDPEEVLVFLDRLPAAGDAPALPVQREMVRGQFGVWLEEILKMRLSEEQAAFMARTVCGLRSDLLADRLMRHLKTVGPDTAGLILDAAGRMGSKGNARLAAAAGLLLKHPEDGVKLAAARALVRLAAPKAADALLLLAAKRPALRTRVAALALALPGVELARFVAGLPESCAAEVLSMLVSLCACFESDRSVRLADALRGAGEAGAAVAAYVRGQESCGFTPSFAPRPPSEAPPAEAREEPAGLLAQFRKLMGAAKDEEAAARSPGSAALEALAPGAEVTGSGLRDVQGRGKVLSKNTFRKATLVRCRLDYARLEETTFTDCKLSDVDLSFARLAGVRFVRCRLESCTLSGALLEQAGFEECTFTGCDFSAAVVSYLTATACLFSECNFWGAAMLGLSGRALRFTACQMAFASLTSADLRGVEWMDCRFERTLFERSTVLSSRAVGCVLTRCGFAGLVTDEPAFLLAEAEARSRAMESLAPRLAPQPLPAALSGAAGSAALARFLESFAAERDARDQGQAFLAHNRRRLEWTLVKLGTEAAEFLHLLPQFLALPATPGPDGFTPGPACPVRGYVPDHTAAALLAKHLPEPPAAGDKGREPEAPLDGLYTIGSVGTVAQGRGSDLDFWVCVEPGLSGAALAAAKSKLAAIEAYAEKKFGLEVHFFLMDMDAVRTNNFGASDQESAGSTQAKLLKEEFYRTVMRLAGGLPAWWFAPAGAEEDAYAACLAGLSQGAAAGLPVSDLGHLGAIGREEFFGASLWQIVKALKKPFKSVMKFAILDVYFAAGASPVLLCDRIKERLAAGSHDLWDVDAYAVLFREVFEHYRAAEKADAAKLMRMAFQQKTGYSAAARTSGRPQELSGTSYMEFFYPVTGHPMESAVSPGAGGGREEDGGVFARHMQTGTLVSDFMFKTYESVMKRVRSLDMESAVSEEDRTKLGRKIMAHFGNKPGKVPRTHFVGPPAGLFSALEFACEGVPGTPMTWIVRGAALAAEDRKAEPEELARDKSPVRLLAWLVANDIFRPGQHVAGGTLQTPVSVPDLAELLAELHEFFPHDATFETGVEEGLKEESVRRALVIANLFTQREDPRIRDAAILYSTNWGELFLVQSPADVGSLDRKPHEFLKKNLPLTIHPRCLFRSWAPRRARCSKVNFG
ncbi:MAG: class I adenylate cyclase [Thermodesulfobacteriota bacterium]